MKFKEPGKGPTVVSKNTPRVQSLSKTAMTDNTTDANIMAKQRDEALRQATGKTVLPNRDAPVNMAELMGNTASVRPSAPLNAEIEARISSGLGAEWVRQALPSKGIPYEFGEVFIRPLTTTALSKLSAASKNKSYSMLVDALDACINVDIRDLTPQDFTFVMYWIRLNSYPNTPISVPWKSKYGNEDTYTLAKTNMEIIELDMTKAEFEANWKSQGLCFPTVRDVEIQFTATIADDDRWRVEMSQYVAPLVEFNPKTYVQDKLDAFEALGVSIVEAIKEFSGKMEHGVVETARVVDRHFSPDAAIAFWRKEADDIEKIIRSVLGNKEIEDGNELALLSLSNRATELREQADAMQARVEEKEHIKPEEEVITLSIGVMDFFPYL